MTVDATEFGPGAPLVGLYVDTVTKINALDEERGERHQSSFWAEVQANNESAVKEAQEIIASIKEMTPEYRAVVSFIINKEQSIKGFISEFSAANAPKVETPKISPERLAEIHESRKQLVGLAQNFHSTLASMAEAGAFNAAVMEQLPEKPDQLRGGLPGKRGTIGRKLPKDVVWNIAGEEHKGLETTDAAKLMKFKSAGALRTYLQEQFPDSLPTPFEFTVNDIEVVGRHGGGEVEADEAETNEVLVSEDDVENALNFDE